MKQFIHPDEVTYHEAPIPFWKGVLQVVIGFIFVSVLTWIILLLQ